jgi:predicted DNA-binding transcriptional regulator YafY
MNRIDRISAILIQLQSKKIVKAQEIAKRFNISLRTVYRDVRTLEEAGVPLVGEAGIGYSIMEGYRLPPVMLTREEATSFITAGKFVEKMNDAFTEENYKSGMFKIKAVLRSAEKDFLEDISDNIAVVKQNFGSKNKNQESHLPALLSAISQKNVLAMEYFANHNQQQTSRHIEPVGIFHMSSQWYLIGWCHLRKAYRHFRVDRIKKLNPTEKKFEKAHPSLKAFLDEMTKKEALTKVVMQIDKAQQKFFGDQKYYNGYVSQKETGNHIEMTFLTASTEGFARWYLMVGDNARILEPASLKKRVKEIMHGISGNIS